MHTRRHKHETASYDLRLRYVSTITTATTQSTPNKLANTKMLGAPAANKQRIATALGQASIRLYILYKHKLTRGTTVTHNS